jgi:hypothetical protein
MTIRLKSVYISYKSYFPYNRQTGIVCLVTLKTGKTIPKKSKIKYQNQIMTVWVETTDMYWSEYATFSGNYVIFY